MIVNRCRTRRIYDSLLQIFLSFLCLTLLEQEPPKRIEKRSICRSYINRAANEIFGLLRLLASLRQKITQIVEQCSVLGVDLERLPERHLGILELLLSFLNDRQRHQRIYVPGVEAYGLSRALLRLF